MTSSTASIPWYTRSGGGEGGDDGGGEGGSGEGGEDGGGEGGGGREGGGGGGGGGKSGGRECDGEAEGAWGGQATTLPWSEPPQPPKGPGAATEPPLNAERPLEQ